MATLFHQKPSDVALLDDCVGELGEFYFNRGIAAFGRAVHSHVEKAGDSSNPAIAQAQRTREWERIMGGDGSAAFRDVGDVSRHSRVIGRDDEDDPDIDDEEFQVTGSYW